MNVKHTAMATLALFLCLASPASSFADVAGGSGCRITQSGSGKCQVVCDDVTYKCKGPICAQGQGAAPSAQDVASPRNDCKPISGNTGNTAGGILDGVVRILDAIARIVSGAR